ncbi:Transglycosylase SLT domain protein [compost metagenome]
MELFAQLERKNGLPSGLLDAVWSAESSRGQNMQSPKGAQGHFQFMPATAAQYGLADPNSLQQSAAAAARMLSDMVQQTGSVPGALAAYNWGIGNVQRKGMDAAPAETRNYIQKVTASMPQQDDPFAELNKEFSQVAPAMQQEDPFAELNKEFMAPVAARQDEKVITKQEPASPSRNEAQMISSDVLPPPHQAGRFGGNFPRLGPDAGKELAGDLGNLVAGGIRGAGSIGATILAPYDIAKDALNGKGLSLESHRRRLADTEWALKDMGADQNSAAFQAGKLGAEIAGTAGMGGLLANGARLLPGASRITPLIESIGSGGFRVGGQTGAPALATRAAGGAITGGASAGLVNPEDAGIGAAVGGAVPGAVSIVGNTTRGIGRAIRGGEVKPAVVELAKKAKDLGIDVPADRIVNSKPMNALAASLEYMPLSGRTATLDRTQSQFNRAITRTFGQDSDNVTMALRQAQDELGSKFDDVLKNNTVKMDQPFTDELATHTQRAANELEQGQASIITKQIDEIMAKVKKGEIDGQAAYNIKKTLDRIGQRNSPEAWYANDLKKSLMGVLNRSLKPEDAAAFAKVRQQYGTMLDLKKMAQNGADGDISIARVANMKNIGNPELQDLADIGAQFLKSRESPHGAMQRIMLGGLGAAGAGSGIVSPLLFGGAVAAGRGANAALNSNAIRGLLMTPPRQGVGLLSHGAEKANKILPLLAPQVVNDR